MFANLIHLLTRSSATPESYDLAFVKEVSVTSEPIPRDRRVEARLIWGWLAIAIKCGAVAWAIHRYHVPVNVWWIVGPTVAMGAVCTGLYIWKR